MAASAKTLTAKRPKTDPLDEGWTIVSSRRGNKKHRSSSARAQQKPPPEHPPVPWVPADSEIDPLRESKLLEKIRTCIERLETSELFLALLDQVESPELSDRFRKALGSEPEIPMVVYGVGSIESYENPRSQLSLALLLKKRLSWVGEVEVFDPILSATESRVLESLGCSVLAVDEGGRRRAARPTLFFMPHCEAELYDNLLRENWSVEALSNVVILGNSFGLYGELSEFRFESPVTSARHVLAAGRFADEFRIETSSDGGCYYGAFHDSSWHFFSPDPETGLPFI